MIRNRLLRQAPKVFVRKLESSRNKVVWRVLASKASQEGHMKTIAAVVVAGCTLSGCWFPTNNPVANGAIVGGAAGAVIGGVATGNIAGAAIGGGVGALTGALIGGSVR